MVIHLTWMAKRFAPKCQWCHECVFKTSYPELRYEYFQKLKTYNDESVKAQLYALLYIIIETAPSKVGDAVSIVIRESYLLLISCIFDRHSMLNT